MQTTVFFQVYSTVKSWQQASKANCLNRSPSVDIFAAHCRFMIDGACREPQYFQAYRDLVLIYSSKVGNSVSVLYV